MGELKFTNIEEVNKKNKGEKQEAKQETKQEESKEKKERYHDKAEVNDIQIEVSWDDRDNEYVIYLPQIDLEHAREEEPEVVDQLIRTGVEDPGKARTYFMYAKKTANRVLDAYDLWQELEEKF